MDEEDHKGCILTKDDTNEGGEYFRLFDRLFKECCNETDNSSPTATEFVKWAVEKKGKVQVEIRYGLANTLEPVYSINDACCDIFICDMTKAGDIQLLYFFFKYVSDGSLFKLGNDLVSYKKNGSEDMLIECEDEDETAEMKLREMDENAPETQCAIMMADRLA